MHVTVRYESRFFTLAPRTSSSLQKKMSRTLFQWRVKCLTDNQYELVWLHETDGEPTVCPVNAAHSISDLDNTIVDRVVEAEVSLKEEYVPTQGLYQSQGWEVDIDANVGSITIMTHTWPYQVSVLMGWFFSSSDNVGDKVEAWVAPDAVTGAIAGVVSLNDDTITVTSTVLDNTAVGYHMKLYDGSNQSYLGRVLEIDSGNSQIVVETPSDQAYSPLTPTYVQQTVRVIDEMYINVPNGRFVFAEKKMGGKGIPPTIPLHVRYHNRTGGAKKFTYNFEYIY